MVSRAFPTEQELNSGVKKEEDKPRKIKDYQRGEQASSRHSAKRRKAICKQAKAALDMGVVLVPQPPDNPLETEPGPRALNGNMWPQMPAPFTLLFRNLLETPAEPFMRRAQEIPHLTKRNMIRRRLMAPNQQAATGAASGGINTVLYWQMPTALLRDAPLMHKWLDLLLAFHYPCIIQEKRCSNTCPWMGSVSDGHAVQPTAFKYVLRSLNQLAREAEDSTGFTIRAPFQKKQKDTNEQA